MEYFGIGQFGLYNNPLLYGSNPFTGYFNNPVMSYNFNSSLFPQASSYTPLNFFQQPSSIYNFLNNPTPMMMPTYNFGGYSNNNYSNFSGFGSYNNYNFLNSGLNPQPYSFSQQNFTISPYSLSNFGNFNFNTNTNNNWEQERKPSSNSSEEKIISNNKQGYGPEFLTKVKKIANNLNCNYKDLLAVMNAESGINTTAINKKTNATGLIQFMPSTAQGLGTSVEQLKKMTPLKQLDFVEKYLQQAKKQVGFSSNRKLSGGELYALVFRPAKVKTGIFASKGEKAYTLNAPLDLNKDGKVTMAELDKRVEKFYVSDKSFMA